MRKYLSHRFHGLTRIIFICVIREYPWLKNNPGYAVSYDALFAALSVCADGLLGCGVIRRYGFGALQPAGNFSFAASSDTELTMITSSPSFQLTGVATLYCAVSCSESITRRISSKLRPVLAGYVIINLTFLSGPITKTDRTVNTSLISGWIMS